MKLPIPDIAAEGQLKRVPQNDPKHQKYSKMKAFFPRLEVFLLEPEEFHTYP
jgi:hypothetical protein